MKIKLLPIALILTASLFNAKADSLNLKPSNFHGCLAAEKAGYYVGNNGWVYSAQELQSNFPSLANFSEDVASIVRYLAKDGITLVPILIPSRPMVYPPPAKDLLKWGLNFNIIQARNSYRLFYNTLRQKSVILPDILTAMNKYREPGNYFFGDHHITPIGASRIADATYDVLKRDNVYENIPKKAYGIEYSDPFFNPDPSRSSILKDKCEQQPIEVFNKVLSSDKDNLGLLDNEIPLVIYAGTSMGRDWWGLPSYLKHKMSIDILDFHIEGGGVYTSLLNYFNSENFKNSKPRIIFWEIPFEEILFDRDGAPNYQQLIYFDQIRASAKTCDNILFSSKILGNSVDIDTQKDIYTEDGDTVSLSSEYPIDNIKVFSDKQDMLLQVNNPLRLTNRNSINQILPKGINLRHFTLKIVSQNIGSMNLKICR